jgi:hypothetical protein
MSESTETTYRSKISILAEFWLRSRGNDDFVDFRTSDDIGLPLAQLLREGVVESTSKAEKLIEKTWSLFLLDLDIEDYEFETLDEMLEEWMDVGEE